MRVTLCVDALDPQLAGIGRYTWELCKGLPLRDEITEIRYFGRNRLIDDPGRLVRGEKLPRALGPMRLVRRMRVKRALRTSLVHGPNYFLPADAETGIITVHDLSVQRYPEAHPAARVAAFERLLENSVRRAAHVITDTETVRAEVMQAFGLSSEAVTAVPLGVDPRFRPMANDELSASLRRWNLHPGAYGLTVSTLEPRKKISELIGAWRRLPDALRNGFPLVIAGGEGWSNGRLHQDIAQGQAEGWLRHLGYVDDALLPSLYAGAALFTYPSIYEGFGLPPLEAMASGVPIIVAGRSCLPEVCGSAARYIDPDDPDGFATAVEECLRDSHWRATSAQRGIERARLYTWERCIEGTVAVYRKAIGTRLVESGQVET